MSLKSKKSTTENFTIDVNGEQMQLVNLRENFTVDVNGQRMQWVSLRENFTSTSDPMVSYLQNQSPTVMSEEEAPNAYGAAEYFEGEVIIPPLNTDIRFSSSLPLYVPSENEKRGLSMTTRNLVREDFQFINVPEYIPDEKPYLPWEHEHPYKKHPKGLHIHDEFQDNFSWAVTTNSDNLLDRVKKTIIHPVSTQHSCGSCWYMYLHINNSLFFIIKKYYDE